MKTCKPIRKTALKPLTGVTDEFYDQLSRAAQLSLDSLKASGCVKFASLTNADCISSPITNEALFARGLANAKLEGFTVTPELEMICRNFSAGNLSLDEALESAGISRRIEFKIQVRVPSRLSQTDVLSRIHETCSDSICGVGKPDQFTLAFERQGIALDETIKEAIKDIFVAIPEVEILEIHS